MDGGGFSEYTWDGEKLELIWGQIHLDFDFGHQLVRFLGGLMRFVFHISYKQQVEGLQDINQLVGLLVPLLCDVPGVSKQMFSQIGINLKELRLFAVFKFDPNTSRNYLCMDHYCNPFSTDELQMMVRIASFCLPHYLFSYYISNRIDSYRTMFTFPATS
ncbi:hypothetical protein DVH24_030071 [Malus domestica]|uniref:Uncharacterized protein n=1 Tax=Malus domestica TaxID=3750 RepID=A0A498HX13_MALDO|nr:hypothetical protein DVH24_030071 [Malus domestica]